MHASPGIMLPVLRLEVKNGVAYVTLNRPEKRNALSHELLTELETAQAKLAADRAVRAVMG